MDLSDLPLLVPVSAFRDYIQCSICMTQLKSTHTTPCGHRYCETCIKEWVDRQHKCPCCNTPVQAAQLIKDHQFDGLIACVLSEKDKSEQEYFEKLLNQATSTSSETGTTSCKSPIETVLKKHLMHSLAAHEKFSQDLKKDFHNRQLRLEEETNKSVAELQNHELSTEEIQSQTQDLQNTSERKTAMLSTELQSCLSLVATSYDKYLSSHIPSLDILPVKISIYLLEKDIRIPNVHLRPNDSLSDVQSVLESHMDQVNNNPIVSMGEDVQWLVFGPFAKGNPWEMRTVFQEISENGDSDVQGVSVISEPSVLSVQYSVKPNSELVVCGTVKCHSDLPKQCFVKIFRTGEAKSVDYFSCKTCGFNWVCRSCREVCHQGHTIVPYIMNHQPTWACCYCPKKKTCVIQYDMDVE